jgi:hypothetical protein
MAGREHRCDMEVVAQGIANIASASFGGISVTGTIARTATNIRAGVQPALRHGECRLRADVHAHCGAAGELERVSGKTCANVAVDRHGRWTKVVD